MVLVRFVMRLRAAPWGEYRRRPATSRMRCRVDSLTGPLSLKTRETVATDTSASRATSLIVATRSAAALMNRHATNLFVVEV